MNTNLKIHYFQHVPFESLGTIQQWIESRGHSLSVTKFFRNDTLPNIKDIDWLIIMGGPMGVYDEKLFPWLAKEKEFISEIIRQNRKILGICLGAQLIASSLGAKIYPNSQKEIGWFPLRVTSDGRLSNIFKNMPQQFTAFHWHADTFGLPTGAHLLAESEICKNQAFSFGEHVLGLQFHLEVMPINVESLIQNCGKELQKGQYIQSAEQIKSVNNYYDINRYYMYQILELFAESI